MIVSIIIPIFNVAQYIEECLRSVMQQTYKGAMECLIIDDCGTDDSIVIAERMINMYDGPIRLYIIHHEHNRGLSAARNTGTMRAKGDYIYYLDSDDEITENCIEKLMAVAIKNPTIEMVQGNAKLNIEMQPDPIWKQFSIDNAKSNEEVRACFYHKHLIPVTAWNKLIKRSFLMQNQLLFKEGLLWEDSHWLFFLLKYATSVSFVSDVTYLHKRRPGSIVTDTDKITEAKHRAIFFHDVLTNLTFRDEWTEMRYIFEQFESYYKPFVRELPEYQELFTLFWNKVKECRHRKLIERLAICYILGKLNWIKSFNPYHQRREITCTKLR